MIRPIVYIAFKSILVLTVLFTITLYTNREHTDWSMVILPVHLQHRSYYSTRQSKICLGMTTSKPVKTPPKTHDWFTKKLIFTISSILMANKHNKGKDCTPSPPYCETSSSFARYNFNTTIDIGVYLFTV